MLGRVGLDLWEVIGHWVGSSCVRQSLSQTTLEVFPFQKLVLGSGPSEDCVAAFCLLHLLVRVLNLVRNPQNSGCFCWLS